MMKTVALTYSWCVLCFICYNPVQLNELSPDDSSDVEADPEFAEYLREAIENFREQMPKGIPEIKMPVLDPLHLEDMDVDVQENVANLQLHISEMLIRGLSNFTLYDIQSNLEEFFIQLNFSMPRILINGEYNLNGRIYTIFPLYGNGNYSINVTDLNVGGNGQLSFTLDTIQITVFELDLYFGKVTMDLGSFLGGGRFGDVMQEIIPGVGRDVFMLYKPFILRKLQEALKAKINDELTSPKVKDFIKDYLPIMK